MERQFIAGARRLQERIVYMGLFSEFSGVSEFAISNGSGFLLV